MGTNQRCFFYFTYVYFKKSICIEPPKKDRKQSIKNKNNRSLSFHFDLFSGCWFVGLSVFPDFHLYLTNYSIKLIYMHIIRTGSMRRLKLCALFVVSTNISREILCKLFGYFHRIKLFTVAL